MTLAPPPGYDGTAPDLGQFHQTSIIVCAAITWAIAAVFVAMRFYTRRWLIHVLAAEDWVILISLIFAAAATAAIIQEAALGYGLHVWTVPLENFVPMLQAGWLAILWYSFTLALTKISILLLYVRTLTTDWSRRASYALLALVVLTNLYIIAIVLTACIPLQSWWDFRVKSDYCHPQSYFWASTAFHMITDFLIFLLPIPVIFTMRVRRQQKFLLYFLFAFGFFVCVISIVRLKYLISQNWTQDSTYDNVEIPIWTSIEINTAIVCACVMTLKPLAAKVLPKRLLGRRSVVLPDVHPHQHPPTIGSQPARFFRPRQASWIDVPGRVHSDVPILEEVEETERQSVKLRDLEAQIMAGDQSPTSPPPVRVRDMDSFSSSNDPLDELGPQARPAYQMR